MFYLSKIELNNFRCYENNEFLFGPNINIIVGDNAAGKTSLIEAIYMIAMCKSFKTTSDNEMIKCNKPYLSIKALANNDDQCDKIIVSITDQGKKINVNNKTLKNLSDYLGYMNVIAFSPEDLKMIKGEPRLRRKFLDINIGQTDKTYLKALISYNKVLKERNELLKNSFTNNNDILLNLYTDKLIEEAKKIITIRDNFLKIVSPYVEKKVNEISLGQDTIKIVYKPSSDINNIERELKSKLEYDRIMKTTTVGPHRDDFVFFLNGALASSFSSQGQQRTIALALKLGLAEYFKRITTKMIIILDDVFGEIDKNRQNALMSVVNDNYQVFITTTNLDSISENLMMESKIINIIRKVK